ncbi:MAG: peptidoglycan DD-metalloendopeptidase family protein [Patescibacteria group bacterium]|nr:peptidoglycan DD-metalloendopeptidase family protein [Patescibacteria group bacterium]MDD4304391.1 peptidoglycan DD-metalloendopeptidase family protein [Patescibacteria group bacterium]MDD4695414.1 peptidoglycan DD-metalloendopeptidase family protein [Patescibacteria group bacterium]
MKTKIKFKINIILINILVLSNIFLFPIISRSESVQEIEQLISEKKKVIDELNQQKKIYQDKIKKKQQEKASFQNQISILDTQIASRTIGLETNKLQIEGLKLELESIKLEIEKKENEIITNKERVKTALQNLYKEEDSNNILKILIVKENLSDFFDEVNKLKTLQADLKDKIQQLKQLKDWLEQKNKNIEQSKTELEGLQEKLVNEQESLKQEQDTKLYFLSATKSDEQQFQNLLSSLKKEQQEADNIIKLYEEKARRMLESNKTLIKDNGTFVWPVPSQYVTTYFHDPDYPFRNIFEHPAIDIRASQGTPIKATASGYVAIAQDNGYGYSYITLVHNNGISTVYGHVSQINVKTGDFVLQGDVIGKSGGTPGTPGAGRLTTGPHLHFEVRLNGTPVNPLIYLK